MDPELLKLYKERYKDYTVEWLYASLGLAIGRYWGAKGRPDEAEEAARQLLRARGEPEEEIRAFSGWAHYSIPKWRGADYSWDKIRDAFLNWKKVDYADVMRRYRAGDFTEVGYPYIEPTGVLAAPYQEDVKSAEDRFSELVGKNVEDLNQYITLLNYCQALLSKIEQLPTIPWQIDLINRLKNLISKIRVKMEELRKYVSPSPELPPPIVEPTPVPLPKDTGLTYEQMKINEQLDYFRAEITKLGNMLTQAENAELYNNVYMDIADNANTLLAQLNSYLNSASFLNFATSQQKEIGQYLVLAITEIRTRAILEAKKIQDLPSLIEAQKEMQDRWITTIMAESWQTSTPFYRDVEAQYGVLNLNPVRPPSEEEIQTTPGIEPPQWGAYTEPLAPGEEASVSERMQAITGQEPWTLAGAEVPVEKKISPWWIAAGLILTTGAVYAYKKMKKRS